MPRAKNYLVVFYTDASPAAGAGALKNVSAPRGNGFGARNGRLHHQLWFYVAHYTYEQTITTTITSASAEKAPHSQPSTLLSATAYSEQGIPVSHHLPAAVTKQVKETPHKAGKTEDAEFPKFHAMAGLLDQMVQDIAKP